MQLVDIQRIFNRAFVLAFSAKKLLLVSIILAFCGLLVVFFRGLALHASNWVTMSLTFIPIFLCAGVLLSAGILLTRIYHDEVKHHEAKYRQVLAKSWEVIVGASYFAIPIVLSYLLLWMTLGIFILLKEIPGIGTFFGAILAFAPFLLNLASLLLCLFALAALFLITPVVALRGVNRIQLAQLLTRRLKSDLFSNLLLALVAILPLFLFVIVLSFAAFLTETIFDDKGSSIYTIIYSFFVMIPFAAILSPAVIFFFNFATEAHILMKPKEKNP